MHVEQVMKWRLRDIIDLEYLVYKDAGSDSGGKPQSLHERDRNIFLEYVMPGVQGDETPDRQFIIKTWLSRRRDENDAKTDVLPGEGVERLYGSFRLLFLVAGLVLGGASGASYLTYTGDSPVNVFVYLSVFVFLQLLLMLLLFVLSMYRLSRRTLLASPLYTLISGFIFRILLSARSRVAGKMTADQRNLAEFTLGTLVSKTRTYGILFFLPIFILTQLFAVGFNLGLLAATLFKVITADIAFGWQSTIQLSPAAVHSLVRKVALPWSWAVPGDTAFPSPAQIEGSRIVLKEGIYHLFTPNLASWWPFLCLAVLVYGLLPRLLLFLGAVAAQRRYLALLDFRQGSYEQLLLRMTTPLVSTRGQTVGAAGIADQEPGTVRPAPVQATAHGRGPGKKLLVMIPDEIYASCSRAEIESVVNKGAGHAIEELIRINQDYAADRQLLSDLHNRQGLVETDILVIQEAWQPPIMEYIDFIKQLRKAVGNGPCIRIGLIGKPRANTIFTTAQEQNLKIWVQKVTAIGDPCIYAEGLVLHAA